MLTGESVYVCTLQLVLSADLPATSIRYFDHTVFSVHLFPHCKSNCAWLAKLSRPKAGKCQLNIVVNMTYSCYLVSKFI